jgi:iron complex outermembrane receptor protein
MPYITYAKASALEMSQAGDVAPSLVADPSDSWLSDSDLAEAGVKFQWLKGTLVGSLAGYRQNRTQLTGITGTPTGTRAKGVEAGSPLAGQRELQLHLHGQQPAHHGQGPGHLVPVHPGLHRRRAGLASLRRHLCGLELRSLPGRAGDYDYTLIPKSVVSLYGAYTSDDHDWGKVGGTLGVTHVTKTAGTVQERGDLSGLRRGQRLGLLRVRAVHGDGQHR